MSSVILDERTRNSLDPWLSRGNNLEVLLDVSRELPPVELLKKAVKLGVPVSLNNSGETPQFSFEFLAPFIQDVRRLWIELTNVNLAHLDVLEEANALEALGWLSPKFDEAVNFANLPRLQRVVIRFQPGLATLLANQNLTDLTLYGFEAPTIPQISAPLSRLKISDRKKQDQLPALSHPDALQEFRVDLPRQFDGGSLLPAVNLKTLQLNSVGRLENLAALTKLSGLERLEIDAYSEEDWDVILDSPAMSALLILSPSPSRSLRSEGARRGWVVAGKHDQSSPKLWPYNLLEGADGPGSVLYLDDFLALSELLVASLSEERVEDLLVNGYLAQELVRAACLGDKELRGIDPEFDSESEGMYVRFPNKKLATRAVAITKALIRNQRKLATVIDAYEVSTL